MVRYPGAPGEPGIVSRGLFIIGCAALFLLCAASPAHASLLITPTFASNITSDTNASAIEGAIIAGITEIESDISSPASLNVTIDFQETGSGLGASSTSIYTVTYYQYYNAFKAVATSAAQLTALASLGLLQPVPVRSTPPTAVTL